LLLLKTKQKVKPNKSWRAGFWTGSFDLCWFGQKNGVQSAVQKSDWQGHAGGNVVQRSSVVFQNVRSCFRRDSLDGSRQGLQRGAVGFASDRQNAMGNTRGGDRGLVVEFGALLVHCRLRGKRPGRVQQVHNGGVQGPLVR
jgi:hypothetical protein